LAGRITALAEHAADVTSEVDESVVWVFVLRAWLLNSILDLGDELAQAVSLGQSLISDSGRQLGIMHPVTVAAPSPPTTTGRPRSSGRRSTSTAAMNWSRSTCKIQRRTSATPQSRTAA
jgi:hypothetical protein